MVSGKINVKKKGAKTDKKMPAFGISEARKGSSSSLSSSGKGGVKIVGGKMKAPKGPSGNVNVSQGKVPSGKVDVKLSGFQGSGGKKRSGSSFSSSSSKKAGFKVPSAKIEATKVCQEI